MPRERRYNLADLALIIADRLPQDAPQLVGLDREVFWDETRKELIVREYVPTPAGKTVTLATEARMGEMP